MATVSVGSNRQYSEGWDAIFKKGKAKKQQSAAQGTIKTTAKAKKTAGAKKKASPQKSTRKSRGKG